MRRNSHFNSCLMVITELEAITKREQKTTRSSSKLRVLTMQQNIEQGILRVWQHRWVSPTEWLSSQGLAGDLEQLTHRSGQAGSESLARGGNTVFRTTRQDWDTTGTRVSQHIDNSDKFNTQAKSDRKKSGYIEK